MADSLGVFNFISLQTNAFGGAPPVLQQHTAIVQRPGVDGTGVILMGTKGDPFQARSMRDVGSVALGNDLAFAYQSTDRTEAWVIVFQGKNYSVAYSTRYFVLRVDDISVHRVSGSRGGVMGSGAGAVVSALWTLVPVFYEEPEEP